MFSLVYLLHRVCVVGDGTATTQTPTEGGGGPGTDNDGETLQVFYS